MYPKQSITILAATIFIQCTVLYNVLYLGKVAEFLPLNSSFIILVNLQPDDANLLKFKLRRVYRFGLGFYPPKNLKIKSFYKKKLHPIRDKFIVEKSKMENCTTRKHTVIKTIRKVFSNKSGIWFKGTVRGYFMSPSLQRWQCPIQKCPFLKF